MLTFRTNSANNVAVEPKQTAFSLLDLGAVGKQKEKEMKDEGGMVKGGGQSAVGSGQSAEEAAEEAREAVAALRRFVAEWFFWTARSRVRSAIVCCWLATRSRQKSSGCPDGASAVGAGGAEDRPSNQSADTPSLEHIA